MEGLKKIKEEGNKKAKESAGQWSGVLAQGKRDGEGAHTGSDKPHVTDADAAGVLFPKPSSDAFQGLQSHSARTLPTLSHEAYCSGRDKKGTGPLQPDRGLEQEGEPENLLESFSSHCSLRALRARNP